MALLDGELSAVEEQEIKDHLVSCTECSSRMAETRRIMAEADGLVEELVVPNPTVRVPAKKRFRRINGRNLAWAASVVAALGLGIAGGVVFLDHPAKGPEVAISPRPSDASKDQATTPPAPEPSESEPVVESPGQIASRRPAAAVGLAASEAGPSRETAAVEQDRDPEERAAAAASLTTNAFAESSSSKLSVQGERLDSAPALARSLADAAGRAAPAEGVRAQGLPQPQAAVSPLVPRDEVTTRQRLDGDLPAKAPEFRQISMEQAVHHLGGVIRLVDGLTPEEFEVAASDSAQSLVRVIYRVGAAETKLVLEQGRLDNGFVASDLQRFNSTVGQALSGNQLSWHDLAGFYLRLYGRISPDSLFHFKSLVK